MASSRARARKRSSARKTRVSVLVGTEDVTAKVAAALAGVAPDKVVEARRAALTKLEQACEEDSKKAKGGALKCERVALYQGGQHWLYKYRRYDDVRLVFVPERDIAAFGGDPDNFQFPRWCLDMSILRAYENGKPAKTPNHLRFNWAGAQPGDRGVRFRPPGRYRSPPDHVAARAAARHLPAVLAAALLGAARPHDPVLEDGRGAAPHGRVVPEPDRELDQGAAQAVRRAARPGAARERGAKEKALRDSVAGNASLASASGAWDEIAKAQDTWRNILVRHAFIEALHSIARPPPSTATSSCTPACSCARLPSAPSRTRRACRNSPRRGSGRRAGP